MATFRERPGKNGIRHQAIVRMGGHPTQRATFKTKTEAKNWATKVEAAIIDGKHFPSNEAKKRTVRELLERYKETEIPKKKDQVNPTRYADYWIDRIGQLKLRQPTRAVVVEVRDELEQDRAPSTVNRYLALLSHACTTAEREWVNRSRFSRHLAAVRKNDFHTLPATADH